MKDKDLQNYAWVITVDHIAFPDAREGTYQNAVGVSGPRQQDHSNDEIVKNGTAFKMYDDDGELYYEGYGLNCEGTDHPLLDFGMPNAGATRIEWKEK